MSVLDFTTIKSELFPVIATIFSKTNSLAIKVRGLQAFVALCGGSNDPNADDGLDGFGPDKKKGSSSSALDKYTMQEKIVPLIKAIKTKEPAVMMAALTALRVIGNVADAEFVAMDILPILWHMSLGPLLDLKQFQAFMELIKMLSRRVEDEQTKKLQELSGGGNVSTAVNDDFMSFGTIAGSSLDANGTSETDFEMLVKGKSGGSSSSNPLDLGWDNLASPNSTVASPGLKTGGRATPTPAFSWSTPSPVAATSGNQFGAVKAQQSSFRTVTPDLGRFEALTPTATQYSQPLQPTNPTPQQQQSSTSVNWGSASAATNNPWSIPSPQHQQPPTSAFGSVSLGQMQSSTSAQASRAPSFALPPPPAVNTPSLGTGGSFSLAPPPGAPQRQTAFGGIGGMGSSGMSSLSSMGNSGMSSLSSMGNSGLSSFSSTNSGMMSGLNSGMNSINNLSSMNNMMNKKNTGGMGAGVGVGMGMMQQQQQQQAQQAQQQQGQKSGLDKYASLL
jgi:SCY1-like protein 2